MAERVQSWALERGLALFAPEGFRSKTVTTIDNQLKIDVNEMNAFLQQHDMRIANGYGQIKSRTFRIGHMGELNLTDVNELLAVMDQYLAR